MNDKIEFLAEVREVKSKKLITNDIEYSVKLTGSSPKILELGLLPAETILKVITEIEE